MVVFANIQQLKKSVFLQKFVIIAKNACKFSADSHQTVEIYAKTDRPVQESTHRTACFCLYSKRKRVTIYHNSRAEVETA